MAKGRATGKQHRRRTEESSMPVFGFYHLDAKEVAVMHPDKPKAATANVRVLVAKCHWSKCTFAHVVPQKGVDPERYAVDRLARDIRWLGHTRIILKTDNEHAILKLLIEVLKGLRIH